MKKLLLIPVLLFCMKISAQKEIVLKDKYFVDKSKIEYGTPEISVREYVNFELFKQVYIAIKSNHRGNITDEDLTKGMENKAVKLSEGNYRLENEEQKAKFKIDKNGNFVGSLILEAMDRDETTYWTINFENGKEKNAEIRANELSDPFAKITVADSAVVVNAFKNQKLMRSTIKKHIDGRDEEIRKKFYENGNLESEMNDIAGVSKQFNEDGTPLYYRNDKTSESIDYDEKGRKRSHFYLTKTEKCDESYKNGIITEKNCKKRDNSEETDIFYKNGKPDKYIVQNNKTHEMREYDGNKKLLNKYEYATPPPPSAPSVN